MAEKEKEEPKSVEDRQRFLNDSFLLEAGKFVQGPLWFDFKRALMARCPKPAQVTDEPHVAAAKGFVATSWVGVIEEIEKLPFDSPPVVEPLIPESLLDQRD